MRPDELPLVGVAPGLPGFLDSEDPRWTNHTVSRMYSVNCRYSDCQFSATSTAYCDEVT